MKRANDMMSLHRSASQKFHRSDSGGHHAKDANKGNQNGKLLSLSHVSNGSGHDHVSLSRDRTTSLISVVQRIQPALAVTPSKDNRSSSRQIVAMRTSKDNSLGCISLDWLSCSMTLSKIRKYESKEERIPMTTEDQLEFLMDKLSLPDLKSAYNVTAGRIGVDPTSVTLPYNAQKNAVVVLFIAMIYDHRSMMYDDTRNAYR
jgi:hypothetical protein